MRQRPEKHLERLVLRAVGRLPDLLVGINTVGIFYRPAARFAVEAALAPFGRAAQQAATDAMARHRVTVGMGVGSPDLLGSYQGRAFGWELKVPGRDPEPHQAAWHRAAAARGLVVDVVRTVDDAIAALGRMAAGAVK